MSIVCNLCQNFTISKLSCGCSKRKENDGEINPSEVEFTLIETKKISYSELIPNNDNYTYLKILKDETIVAISGEFLLEMPLKNEDILNKKIYEIDIYPVFFIDYIRPLFLIAIDKGEAYQFAFRTNITTRNITCSIYPCSLPGSISSCDVVIRYNHHVISSKSISNFAFTRNDVGEKVDILY